MKNIFKYLLLVLVSSFIVTSCDNEADRDWTTPEPSFKLYDTTLGSNVLYTTMEDNPFILTWDNTTGTSGNYSVVVSSTEDFAKKVEVGTSTTNTFKTTIGALNTAMLQAGLSPYSAQTAYIRIEAGTAVSNTINFNVTPYPVAKPIITSPTTSGAAFVLDVLTPDAKATDVTWTDYSTYGVPVNYTIEVAKKGSATFVPAGAVTDLKTFVWTHKFLNNLTVLLGLAPNVSADLDVRVTATTASTGGTIAKTSDVVSFKVTPYVGSNPMYLVGGGTAVDWKPENAQLLLQEGSISTLYAYLANEGSFRFLGQQDWNGANYSLDDPTINATYRYFKTWSSNLEPDGTENIKFTGNSGLYKIVIDQTATVKSITVTPSSTPTAPSDLYIVGSITGWNPVTAPMMVQVGNGVWEYTTVLPDNAEFKFIGQQAWADLEWADIQTSGNSGYLGPKNDNNNIKFNGGDSTYKITANINLGTYTIVKQ